MSETNTEKKKVSPEFVQNVKKYLEIDDKIRELKEKIKIITADKKEKEEYILSYLQTIGENVIDVADGKLKRNVTKSQAPLKKELIQKTLAELVGDSNKAVSMTEEIIKSRPLVERVSLRRTKVKVKE